MARKARQRRLRHHLVAHDHVGAGLPGPGPRPCDAHDAHRAIEGRQLEFDLRGAVGPDPDHARITGERLLRRLLALELRGGIAAAADGAAHPLHAVDDIAVEVAQIVAELALAEEIAAGIGALVARQVEDADIDGGDRDISFLAGFEPGELHRQRQRRQRPHQFRRAEIHGKRALLLADLEPGEADGSARQALGGGVHRPVREHDEIGAGAPFRLDRDRGRGAALGDVDRAQIGDLVGDHGQRRLAGEARREPHLQALAIGVGSLVERDVEHVRRIGRLVALVADAEGDRGRGFLGPVGGDVEAVIAPLDRGGDLRRRIGRDGDLAIGDATGRGDALIVPAAVLEEPLVVAAHLREHPFDAGPRDAPSIPVRHDDVEGRGLAVAEVAVLEGLAHAYGRALRHDRQRHRACDGAPAGLADAHGHLDLERAVRLGLLDRVGDRRLAGGVGGGALLEFGLDRVEGLVGEPDLIVLEAGNGALARGAQRHRAGDVEGGAGRAVEIAGGDPSSAGWPAWSTGAFGVSVSSSRSGT